MLLGPSAAVPRIDASGPMFWFDVRPGAGLVIALERLGALAGALGTITGLVAVRGGWRPSPWLLTGIGVIAVLAFVFLPPAGSTDVLNYASYGRIASLGHSPYVMTPQQLLNSGDPVGKLTPAAWRTAPTIYGPVATAAQWAAAELGGESMARIVFWIRLGKALAFLGTGAALIKLTSPDLARQLRVSLIWTASPLMLFWLVGSGHVDVFIALFTACALLALRRTGVAGGLLAGLFVGAAIAVKLTYAIVAAGLAWPVRRSAATILAGACAVAAVVGSSYLWPGATNTAALSRRLSAGARFIFYLPQALASRPALLTALILAATVVIAGLLIRGLPPEAADCPVPGVRLVLALAVASLVVLPVQTPWYDALIFVLLALMPPSGLDYLLVARCLLLTELVLPGAAPDTGISGALCGFVSHVGIFVVLIAIVIESWRRNWLPEQARPVPA
ncbi:MAG TPA: hypothetical protein VFI65_25295 [Streptosporangiaceae bacterium]|nr:hypothetical protein [Streptosporangiaceae bacterium]